MVLGKGNIMVETNWFVIFWIAVILLVWYIYRRINCRTTSGIKEIIPVKLTKDDLRQKIKKRKKFLIKNIQSSIIQFTRDEYLDCRVPLGIASEVKFKEGNIKEAWCYIIIFKDSKYTIKFTAQIRANLIEIYKAGVKYDDYKEDNSILSFVDQTLQHSSVFNGPTDISNKCSLARLKKILALVERIRDKYERGT